MKLLKVLIILLATMLIGIFVFVVKMHNRSKTELINNAKKIDELKKEITHQTNKARLERSSENLFLNEKLQLTDINNNITNFRDIIHGSTLVFRYSILNCGACVAVEFNNMRELNIDPKILNDKIIFVSYYEDIRSQIIAYKSMNLKVPMYIIPNNKLGLPIEEHNNNPYYFIISKDLSVSNVFIPDKEHINFTKEYLTIVINRILNKQK